MKKRQLNSESIWDKYYTLKDIEKDLLCIDIHEKTVSLSAPFYNGKKTNKSYLTMLNWVAFWKRDKGLSYSSLGILVNHVNNESKIIEYTHV